MEHAKCVPNRVELSTTGLVRYEAMMNESPNVKDLRVFGCIAYVRIPQALKFEAGALDGVLLETFEHGMFRILGAVDRVYQTIESIHVRFDQCLFPGT